MIQPCIGTRMLQRVLQQFGFAVKRLMADAYSRKIVGHCVNDNLKAESVIDAYKQALQQQRSGNELIHHSDRSIQYCSAQHQELHYQYGAYG